MANKLAPVVLFCYNRLDVLIETVNSLKNNLLACDSELFIFSDGAKEKGVEKVNAVRKYIHTITGFKSIKIIESEYNKGLAHSIIDGVTNIVDKYGKIIVLEDDLITSPYFLTYINDALNMYENDEQVACITGYTYPLRKNKNYPQSFFIKGSDCWSWATWKRSWDLFEPDGQKLLDEIKAKNLESDFDFDDSYPFVKMLEDQIAGKNSSWAIRWYASCYLKNKLCLYLSKPVVNNIGFGKNATHCTSDDKNTQININCKPFKLEKVETKENIAMKKEFSYFMKRQTGKTKGNFFLKVEKQGSKVTITILNFIKFSYFRK